jgi:multidrug resistance efflux pump
MKTQAVRNIAVALVAIGLVSWIAQLENSVIKENLRIAELDLAKAQKDVARYQTLAEAGAVTQRELEDAQIALRTAEGRIAELNDLLANSTIVAPINGNH